jgi:hypothetical protein
MKRFMICDANFDITRPTMKKSEVRRAEIGGILTTPVMNLLGPLLREISCYAQQI